MKYITKRGKRFYVGESNAAFWMDMQEGRWEENTYVILDRFLNRKHAYLDIGAWIGPTVLYGSQIAAKCFAVEPDPIAFVELQRNLDLNPDIKPRVSVHNCCITDVCGVVALGTKSKLGDSTSSVLYGQGLNSVLVESVTLPEFVRRHGAHECNFVKMDIEGGEALVLRSSRAFFERWRPTLHLSLHPFLFKDIEGDCKAILDVLRIYKHVYDSKGNKVVLRELFPNMFRKIKAHDVVATDQNWGMTRRVGDLRGKLARIMGIFR